MPTATRTANPKPAAAPCCGCAGSDLKLPVLILIALAATSGSLHISIARDGGIPPPGSWEWAPAPEVSCPPAGEPVSPSDAEAPEPSCNGPGSRPREGAPPIWARPAPARIPPRAVAAPRLHR